VRLLRRLRRRPFSIGASRLEGQGGIHVNLSGEEIRENPEKTLGCADARICLLSSNAPMPAVVAGLDGAAWQLLQPLLDAGSMPRLKALMENGAAGTLSSTIPPVTPPAWTSAVTGVNPGRHGIYGFHRGHAQYEHQELMHSGRVQAATLWEIANEQGQTTGIYNLPMTYPPVPLKGWMVSGFMTPGVGQHMTGFVWPEELEKEILSWEPDYVIEIKSNQEQDWRDAALAERALAALRQRHAVLTRLLQAHPVDIVFTVLETPDRLQHLYYRYMDPNEQMYSSAAARRIQPTITKCFEMMDNITGLLHDYAGDGGVIVCSDHGFTAWDVSVHTNSLLEKWGYLKLKSGARLMQNRLVAGAVPFVRRVLPTKIRREAKRRTFGAIDWSKTKAFASVYYQEGIFINQAGRERFGIVPESEAKDLKDELELKLRNLRGPDDKPVVDEVFRSENVFSGDALEGAPDLIMFMRNHNYVPDDEVFHRNPFTDHGDLPRGGHHPDGIVVVGGNGVRAGAQLNVSIIDVTPTLLYMAGLKVPEGIDGSVMTAAFEPSHLEAHPVEITAPVEAEARDESSPYSAEEEALIEESLRGLGYL
jgi:predicted AlkP superfamily phosphohydrolase/phosphomutase